MVRVASPLATMTAECCEGWSYATHVQSIPSVSMWAFRIWACTPVPHVASSRVAPPSLFAAIAPRPAAPPATVWYSRAGVTVSALG